MANESSRVEASRERDNKAIVNAFRFLENLTDQVNLALKAIASQLQELNGNPLGELGLEIRNIEEGEDACSPSEWVTRSTIRTFEVVRKRKKGLEFLGAIQASLAPANPRADDSFVPHIAILLAKSGHADPWECEEFILDDEFLSESDESRDRYPWARVGEWHWVEKSEQSWAAFVVPLTELRNEADVRSLVVNRLASLARDMRA